MMTPSSLFFVVLQGKTYPFVVFGFLLVVVLYQLISGDILNLSWDVWLTRSKRPSAFWAVLSVEAALALLGLYIGCVL